MAIGFTDHGVSVINVSIRHALPDTEQGTTPGSTGRRVDPTYRLRNKMGDAYLPVGDSRTNVR